MNDGSTRFVIWREWHPSLLKQLPAEMQAKLPRYDGSIGKVKSPKADVMREELHNLQRDFTSAEETGDIEQGMAMQERMKTLPVELARELLNACDVAENATYPAQEAMQAELTQAEVEEQTALQALEIAEGNYYLAAYRCGVLRKGIHYMEDRRNKARYLREQVAKALYRIRQILAGGMFGGMTAEELQLAWRNVFALLGTKWWMPPPIHQYQHVDSLRNQELNRELIFYPDGKIKEIKVNAATPARP